MKIKKDILQELTYENEVDGFKSISKEMCDHTRWSIHYEQIIQDVENNKFYKTWYSIGATEQQDESPYEYEDDEIEVTEVFPIEKTITVYE